MTHSNQYHLFQKYLDHCFSRIKMEQMNYEKFVFPHTQVGYDGVFDAYRYLFSRSAQYQHLTSQDGVLLLPAQSERFPLEELVTELVNEERAQFRKNHNIGESDTVLFLAGGNRPYEIKWSIPTVNKGLKQFLSLPGRGFDFGGLNRVEERAEGVAVPGGVGA